MKIIAGLPAGFVAPINEVEFELAVLEYAVRSWRRRVTEAEANALRRGDRGVE